MSCTKLQLPPEPLTRGLPPPDPGSLCPQLNLLNPPGTKFLGTPLSRLKSAMYRSVYSAAVKLIREQRSESRGE